jgi:mono/diheme cytochrome c family protein
MDSNLLVTLHLVTVSAFLLLYVAKAVLLFLSPPLLDRFSKAMRLPEILFSVLFLVSGIWLFSLVGAIRSLQIVKLVLVAASIPVAAVGFRKHRRGLALAAVLLLTGAYGLSEAGRSRPYLAARVEVSGEASGAISGIELYAAHCTPCHGADGRKQYRGAADLSTSRMDVGMAESVIASGVKRGRRGTMPAYAGLLNTRQAAAVAAYIQELKK